MKTILGSLYTPISILSPARQAVRYNLATLPFLEQVILIQSIVDDMAKKARECPAMDRHNATEIQDLDDIQEWLESAEDNLSSVANVVASYKPIVTE